MRSLTPMFSLNPKTWSGNLLWISILLEKTKHRAYSLADEWYLIQHVLCPVIEKWCHRGSAFSLKQFSPKPLCHKGTKAVPLVKMEKEKILEASRTWASCPPLSLSIWDSLSSISPFGRILEPPHPQFSQLSLSIEPYKYKLMSILEGG